MVNVYALCDPNTLEIRYIGKTVNIERRLRDHKNDSGETRKCRWLRSLSKQGLEPSLFVLDKVDENSWEEAERRWIKYFRDLGANLTNHTDGGEGFNGLPEESKKKMSVAAKQRMANPEYRAKIFTPQRAEKLSKALKGRIRSKEHSEALSRVMKGRKPKVAGTPEHNAKVGDFFRGRPKSDQQKQKMSKWKKEWWRKKKQNEPQILGESSTSNGKPPSITAA